MTALLLMANITTLAQDEHLKLHFDFSQVEGSNVTDAGGGITAKLVGAAKVEQVGNYHVLNLGNASGYLNMTDKAGEVVKTLNDFTLSVCYRVADKASLSGNGYFLWAFSTSAACTQTAGKYMAYRLNAQRMATSTGGYGSENAVAVGSASEKGRWINVVYRQSGARGELFIDGKSVGQNTAMPILSKTFTATPTFCWLGRAPFSGDSYLKQTLVADFRLYDVAVSNDQLAQLAATAQLLEEAYKYGEPGDFSALKAKVDECKAFLQTDVSGYAPNAVAELQDQVTIAEKEIGAARASQTLIDQYVAQLTQLLKNAKATAGYAPKMVMPLSEDHGFIHPGGIVSQQDIDRAKQLLAEGNTRMKRAWNILCSNEYAQASVATYPVETIVRGGSGGQNYMNVARGAAMAYQNALRWKIGGTKANADGAVRILMAWARGNRWVSGDTNLSLAAGIYGYELANAAELMRDYEGWSREDFDEFRRYMIRTWYNPAIDFLRRRHDTWLNGANSGKGQRPGHYWSNWGLCNALCVMSIGILCDDVHMYNQGVSFYKYDHVGTFKDRSGQNVILNDGCNEFIGNLVPVVLPDERGPLGYMGQMQESGRDQGHALMALGLALDICQVGLTQGDDLYAYMDDRIAAGLEHVAALNFGGVAGSSLPWKNYNYADCRTTMGAGWAQTAPNEGGKGEYRPYWDRAIGYYEGLRGVKLQYAEKASAVVCPDGGGGNYSQNSGGFDHVGFSTLTSWRPAITADEAITPLSGDMIYKGETLTNQTNLGGLKYNYTAGPSKAIPADGADITLVPQLPSGVEDTGKWLWNTGETTRQITVKADRSYIYRVTYTAANGAQSQQAFAIAVSGDAPADQLTGELSSSAASLSGSTAETTDVIEATVLSGSSVTLTARATTGWTNDYLWDNGQTDGTITIPVLASSRTYTCQYANQSGAVSETRFRLNAVDAMQIINGAYGAEATLLPGSVARLQLAVPGYASADDITWHDGTKGAAFALKVGTDAASALTEATATFQGVDYVFRIHAMGSGQYPVDATSLIVNPDFATIDGTGWTMTGSWGNQRFNGAVEVWHSTNFDFSQTIGGLPDGRYTVTCQLANGEGRNTATLYATSGDATKTATVKQSAAGSNFDAQRDRMAANEAYARLSVSIDVSGGSLTIGIREPSSGNTWLVWDNFTLAYHGPTETGISELPTDQPESGIYYDMQGRRISDTPKKGIWISNGKKIIR
ncbi:MAG: alginate lyase family protein [Prevotella sp.]|nr:alginate lyase family protein [Prevotella sp.]